jgi:hypothetical protein
MNIHASGGRLGWLLCKRDKIDTPFCFFLFASTLMFHFNNVHRQTVLEGIPSDTKVIQIHACRHLEILRNVPDSVEEIHITHAPNLRTIHPIPSQLRFLELSNTPSLFINSLPSSLRTIDWFDCNPLEMPKIPSSVTNLRIVFDRMPELPNFNFINAYHTQQEMKENIQAINMYFAIEKAQKNMQIFGHELKLKALSPERVKTWLGSEDNPQWELLDSIFGI